MNAHKAASRFQRAADDGDVPGYRELGFCVRDGVGEEKDSERAAELFKTAAAKGDLEGKVHLGLCYRRGEGLEQSDNSAMKILREALSALHKEQGSVQ